ncbi:hypothetical protein [Burkholderia metallica]|uniref:hypothetical protein n=1 Tax=Burkholderia metallica TaxID=488729 RepID=UPI001CF1CFD3|nr:hypothetical protein [Burkholderia metallica]MCA8018109.1 hypothetical protein [Burkholderia metallica]
MNEIKHTPGPWEVVAYPEENFVEIKSDGGYRLVATVHYDKGNRDANARLIHAALDMTEILEFIAADADAGKVMIPSGLRLSIDAALIKAGRKAAPEPVRHVTIAGVGR